MERGWFMTQDSIINSAPASDMVAVYATAKDIACAMAYIHSKDIIHGDLRGDSLGLESSDQDQRKFIAKVMDFDVAVKAQDVPVACNTMIAGFTHMAPEMIIDRKVTKVSFSHLMARAEPCVLTSSMLISYPVTTSLTELSKHVVIQALFTYDRSLTIDSSNTACMVGIRSSVTCHWLQQNAQCAAVIQHWGNHYWGLLYSTTSGPYTACLVVHT